MMGDFGDDRWLPVVGFGGLYEVSTLGRIRSLRTGRINAAWPDDSGYPRIGLWNGSTQKKHRVHRLVAEAFHGDKRNALHCEVAHLDNDRTNCRADNLKWVSHVENHSHRRAHGTHPSGENHPRSRLTERDVARIRTRYATSTQIAADYGVNYMTVREIWQGKRWRASFNRG